MSEVNSAGYAAKVKALSNEMYLPISIHPEKIVLNRDNTQIYFSTRGAQKTGDFH